MTKAYVEIKDDHLSVTIGVLADRVMHLEYCLDLERDATAAADRKVAELTAAVSRVRHAVAGCAEVPTEAVLDALGPC